MQPFKMWARLCLKDLPCLMQLGHGAWWKLLKSSFTSGVPRRLVLLLSANLKRASQIELNCLTKYSSERRFLLNKNIEWRWKEFICIFCFHLSLLLDVRNREIFLHRSIWIDLSSNVSLNTRSLGSEDPLSSSSESTRSLESISLIVRPSLYRYS